MTSVLIVFQVLLTIAIVIVVLLQKSSSIGLGAYSGSNESLFGAKGPANFMAKITMFLGLLFIINTIALGYLYNTKSSRGTSVLDGVEIPKALPITPTDNAIPLSSPLLQGVQPALPQTPLNPSLNTESIPQDTKTITQGDK
ncbi:preprotein translocase subunit SecG [Helicobacter trogontum]|uniref:Protein-export membrane protein SecG n=1 Tax=Helicobacter trogontum TaxID=50960 RepID=A0A4U8T9E8_9HELI|nr:preprotein translocase subunit SecG [Helicobacter trogontum]MDY5185154.1 preprotein translocase subunit SecG [Helicobacter trogontum]TLD96426.1 preprotein translocase subunit SecG [Helicobacter trogontum]